MMRPAMHKWSILARVLAFSGVVVAAGAIVEPLQAVGLNYVDASDFTNLTPTSAIDSFASTAEPDNLWDVRTDFGLGLTVLQSISEDSPVLSQMITGLTPGANYDLYAVFQTDDDENWLMSTGLAPGNLTQYSFRGGPVGPAMVNSTPGITAAAAVWDTLPPANKEGTVFTERPADTLVLLLGKAGTATANGSGQINVLMDDLAGANRTWLEGVAYAAAGTPISLVTTLDRATGAITITNPTTEPFQITSYTIDSVAGGLDATTWTQVAGWDVTAMPDTAATFATQLAQTDPAGTGRTIAANGGSLSFGNVWNSSPFEDVFIRLTLANNEIAVILPQYSGTAITAGDFNGSGTINLEDFQLLLTNLHTNVSTLSAVESYQRGDMNGDRAINFGDFRSFRIAYDAANGAGSFAQLVPEPGTIAMLMFAAVVACFLCPHRRLLGGVAASLVFLTVTCPADAQPLLAVDVDARAGDSTAGPPGDNTVPGFSSYTITPGTTGAQSTTTGIVNGYTITLTAVDSTGSPVGMFDDRDRATPTTAPNFNQLYDDFIFSNVTTTGMGGGWDMAIDSGGALAPNSQYSVAIYSFDTGSTGATRTSNWLDGNAGNAQVFQTSFAGAASPTTDDQYKFGGVFRTDGSGNLLLRARETTGTTHGVFLNGFTISELIELTLEVNTTTGTARIANEQNVNFDMSYYEIRSASGALNPSGWSSFDDAEGGDAVGTGWDEAAASTTNILSEVNLTSLRSFSPGSSASLGSLFTTAGAQDLRFFYASPTETALRAGIVKFVSGPSGVAGDYNGNNVVDAADYVAWRNAFGTPTTLPNDSTPGTVDQSDFNIWRANFGRMAGAGAGLAAGAAVPEPSTLVLVGLALLLANSAAGLAPRGRN